MIDVFAETGRFQELDPLLTFAAGISKQAKPSLFPLGERFGFCFLKVISVPVIYRHHPNRELLVDNELA
ncbi:hypothetical protein REC12_23310 [Desulfosporosinus sp. PR]|nr:hypothetical protein [Desulfosporosinus sp. PR]